MSMLGISHGPWGTRQSQSRMFVFRQHLMSGSGWAGAGGDCLVLSMAVKFPGSWFWDVISPGGNSGVATEVIIYESVVDERRVWSSRHNSPTCVRQCSG